MAVKQDPEGRAYLTGWTSIAEYLGIDRKTLTARMTNDKFDNFRLTRLIREGGKAKTWCWMDDLRAYAQGQPLREEPK